MSTKPSLPSGDAQFGFAVLQITRNEYTSLVKIAQQYDTLCRNLINGGVQRETIELLSLQTSNGPEPRVEKNSFHAPVTNTSCSDQLEQHHAPTTSYQTSHADPYRFVTYSNSRRNPSTADGTESDDLELVDDSSTGSEIEKSSAIDNQVPALFNGSSTPAVRKNATRTVQLINLAEGTTLANITSVVKGGFLVNIYSRLRDNLASLSFLHSSDAHAFYSYVQANGLYINNKKVDIRWDERQFTLSGHVAHKISLGACRNIVIRYCNPNLTEQEIRNDLEHIHNLVVIQVHFTGGHCFISTNSVAAAMFARTCMMSRQKYKGSSRIEWGVDECAQPLHKIPVPKQTQPAQIRPKAPTGSTSNRFRVLSFDE